MRERGREVRGVSGASRRKQEVARGSRRWPRPLGRAPRLGPSGEEEDDRGSGDGLGRAGPGKWAPGNFLLSLSLLFLFYFCYFVFDLI